MKTDQEKIAVMQAAVEGKEIEFRVIYRKENYRDEDWATATKLDWNWQSFDYRVKPQEPRRIMISLKNGVPIETWSPSPIPHYHQGDCAAEFIELTPEVRKALNL